MPDKVIAEENGVRIEHNYRSNNHGYGHMHVVGGGETTRIGPNGQPYRDDPDLSAQQKAVVDAHLPEIRCSDVAVR